MTSRYPPPGPQEMDPVAVCCDRIDKGPHDILGDDDIERERVEIEILDVCFDEHYIHPELAGIAPGLL